MGEIKDSTQLNRKLLNQKLNLKKLPRMKQRKTRKKISNTNEKT